MAGVGDDDRMESGWSRRPDDPSRFRIGRDGDDLLVSFECDDCIFEKLYQALPNMEISEDRFAMACIRRINLDAF